jgi:hypothetical protein
VEEIFRQAVGFKSDLRSTGHNQHMAHRMEQTKERCRSGLYLQASVFFPRFK